MRLKERFARMGVKWRIFAGLALFVAVMLALLWVFQVLLLNDFYKAIKLTEIHATTRSICRDINEPDLTARLQSLARGSQLSILILDSSGTPLQAESSLPNSLIMSGKSFPWLKRAALYDNIYRNRAETGGEYTERFYETPSGSIVYVNPGAGLTPPDTANLAESVIFAKLAETGGGEPLLVMVNAVISPVGATVQTLRIQLWCITAVMLVLALLLALYLSRRISKPIEKINASAKMLAAGNQGISFEASGYKEIAELGATLTYAAHELNKVETLQRDLIANISHDLRTPLTMIAGYAEVMRDLPGENTPENVQIIIDEATRLSSLVNDVLDLSRLQSGAMALDCGEYCLTDSVRGILKRYAKLTDYNISFYAEGDVIVYADELKISQVLYNLVNNAITYTGDDKAVTLRQILRDGRVRVEVRDTGEGIAQDKLGDIWQRYYKVDKAHKRAQVGTGLGLSIVKSILELHGGAYGVSSRENEGSTFWFELPVAGPPFG